MTTFTTPERQSEFDFIEQCRELFFRMLGMIRFRYIISLTPEEFRYKFPHVAFDTRINNCRKSLHDLRVRDKADGFILSDYISEQSNDYISSLLSKTRSQLDDSRDFYKFIDYMRVNHSHKNCGQLDMPLS